MPIDYRSNSERNIQLMLFLHQLGLPLSDQEIMDINFYIFYHQPSLLKRKYT